MELPPPSKRIKDLAWYLAYTVTPIGDSPHPIVRDICKFYARYLPKNDTSTPPIDFKYLVIGNRGWGYQNDLTKIENLGDYYVVVNLVLVKDNADGLLHYYQLLTLFFLKELKHLIANGEGEKAKPVPYYPDWWYEENVKVEADWGVKENSTELKTVPVTLVYGQPKQPEYRGYDLVDWLD